MRRRGAVESRFAGHCIGAMAFLGAAAVEAQPSQGPGLTPREHFDRAVRLSAEGDMRAGLIEFRAAYEGSQNPEVLFNIAAAHERLNEYVEARDVLERYQRLAPPDAVARHREEIVSALTRLATRIGTLRVRAEAPGIVLSIDGVERRESEWRGGIAVSAGVRRVRAIAPGFEPVETQVEVTGNGNVEVGLDMQRVRSSVQVEANIRGAAVLVDGREVGRTPLPGPVSVTEGRHRVVVRYPGYDPVEAEVDARGAGATVNARLRWAEFIPEAEGSRLVVRTNETGGYSTLDGHRVPMDGSVTVPPGPHVLRVIRSDFLPVERNIDLTPGQRTSMDVMLRPTDGYRENFVGTARRQLVLGSVLTGIGGAILLGAGIWVGSEYAAQGADDERIAVIDVQLNNCRMGVACPPEQSTALLAERQAITDSGDSVTNALIAGGIMSGTGLAVAIVGVAILVNGQDHRRFDRPPVWRVGFGPREVGVGVTF